MQKDKLALEKQQQELAKQQEQAQNKEQNYM